MKSLPVHRVVVGPESGKRVHFGISTCPNDTFAFAALLENRVDTRGLKFEIELLDIRQLNDGLFEGRFDGAKASFHAALLLANQTVVLPVGSALGFGVGPLLLASGSKQSPVDPSQLTLCPGEHTTAKLLFDLFYPNTTAVEHVVFSEIMPRLSNATADFGVCIHEGRFTYQQSGLHLVEDLGERWERDTGQPLPLGGLLMRRGFGQSTTQTIIEVIRESLQNARDRPSLAMPTMRRYAQDQDDEVIMQHVDLYVNDWTIDLGEQGENALRELSKRSLTGGVAPATGLEVVSKA